MKGFKRLLLNLLLLPVFGVCAIPESGVSEDVDFDTFFEEASNSVQPEGGTEEPTGDPEPEEGSRAKEGSEAGGGAEDKDKAERERLEQEAADKEKREKAEKEEKDRLDAQAREAVDRAANEKAEKEKQEREKAEKEKPSPEEEARLAEEKAKDEQFRKEWPDHARLLDKQSAEIADLKKLVQETLASVKGQVEPIVAATQAQEAQKHQEAILDAHSDALDILPDVEAWINEQPDYLQSAYNNVLDNGSSQQVIDFLNTFKTATGRDKAAADNKEKEEKERLEKERQEEERQKALHLTPVGSRRSNVTDGALDADDFDGAFNAAAKEEERKQKVAA